LTQKNAIDLELTVRVEGLREMAIHLLKTEYGSNCKYQPRDMEDFFMYFFNGQIAGAACFNSLELYYGDNNECLVDEEGYWLLPKILNADIDRVNIPSAIAAWLTIDHWRVSDVDEKRAPEDLSYGIVLDYPIPIIRYAEVFLYPDSMVAMEVLESEDYKEAKSLATKHTTEKYKVSKKTVQDSLSIPMDLEMI
jgi:hypothetical protein